MHGRYVVVQGIPSAVSTRGGATGCRCGFFWTGGSFVELKGDDIGVAGEGMDALAAVLKLLNDEADKSVIVNTGTTPR
ncbi:hypothetical protein G3M48_003073 [Beauveria asiatica]|uniref:Uncharacterized protein n=1 Tax=Beauveria asiatica TaxID=1069075 RepID=A0AAW0RXC4_9HYPO